MEKGKSVVIQLPDEDMLQRADLNSDQLESLVKSMLGSQVGRGIDDPSDIFCKFVLGASWGIPK